MELRMKRMLRTALLAGCTLIAGTAIAAAQSDGPPADGMGEHHHHHHHGGMGGDFFDKFDLNHDGKITKDEVAQVEKQRFSEMSKGAAEISKDQFIDSKLDEMRRHIGDMFDHLDKNHDGKLSEDEFAGKHAGMFDHLDKNHDGFITKDELPKPGDWHHHHDGDRDHDDGKPGPD